MAIWTIITIIASVLLSIAFAPKPQQRDQRNEVTRKGVDHPLERVYGKNRLFMVVTDHTTSRRNYSPDQQTPIPNVIRSNIAQNGDPDTTSDSKEVTLCITGPLCVAGRLNAPFQGSTPADVNSQVNEKAYDDPSLRTDYKLNVGASFELHLAGGTRHPFANVYGLGDNNSRYTGIVGATCTYILNLEKEITYSGIPEQSFDLTANLLYDPLTAGNVWNDPATWTGRADDPWLQLLDYLLDDVHGAGMQPEEFDFFLWLFALLVGQTPTATIVETTRNQQFYFDDYDNTAFSTVTKEQTVGPLLQSNLTLSTEKGLNENIEQLLAACRGAALWKRRTGQWGVQPDWIHEDDLIQQFTGETGAGPFPMDWPTQGVIVRKNGGTLAPAEYTITTDAVLEQTFNYGVPNPPVGTDPDDVIGITFTTDLVPSDVIELDFRFQIGPNPDGIRGMQTEFHIVDDPETIGLSYDAEQDANGIDLLRIHDADESEYVPVSTDDKKNQCIVKFRDKETKYKQNQVVWPPDDSAQLVKFRDIEDNGKSLIETVEINSITSKEHALDYAEFRVRSSRSLDTIRYVFDIYGLQLEPMDTVLIHDKRLNINGELWRCTKADPQPDTTVVAFFKRYEREDFTWAVERFSQRDTDYIYRAFGPVLNLQIGLVSANGIFGGGTLSWDAPAQGRAGGYHAAVSSAPVWDIADSYAAAATVYYATDHYTASVAIAPGRAAPDVNPDWVRVNDDERLWRTFQSGPSLSAVVPAVTAEQVYAYRVTPYTPLQANGEPAFLKVLLGQTVTLDDVTSETEPDPSQYPEGAEWYNPSTGEVKRIEGGAWVAFNPDKPTALRLTNPDPADPLKFLGREAKFDWQGPRNQPWYWYDIEIWPGYGSEVPVRKRRSEDRGGPASARFFQWSFQDAIDADPGGTAEAPQIKDGWRTFEVRVFTLFPDEVTRSVDYASITVTNDQLQQITGFVAQAEDRTIVISHAPIEGSDFAGIEVHSSTSPGYTPDATTLRGVIYAGGDYNEIRGLIPGTGLRYLSLLGFDVWGKERALMTKSAEIGVNLPANFGGLAYSSSVSSGQIQNNAVIRSKIPAGELIETTYVEFSTIAENNPSGGSTTLSLNFSFAAQGDGVITFKSFAVPYMDGLAGSNSPSPSCRVNMEMRVDGGAYDDVGLNGRGGSFVNESGGSYAHEWNSVCFASSEYSLYGGAAPVAGSTVEVRVEFAFGWDAAESPSVAGVLFPFLEVNEYNNT